MKSAIGRSLMPMVFVVMGGLLVAVAAFFVTSYSEVNRVLGGPGITIVAEPGFDPWTGLPHGGITGWHGTNVTSDEWIPPDMVGRRGIPLPVGFALGALITIGLFAVRWRPRQPAGVTNP
jgi:hypothetical protein